MKIHRLAQLLELKYGLKSLAASKKETVDEVKKDLLNAYRLYISGDKAKEPIFQMLADIGEPFSQGLLSAFEGMIANLNKISAPDLYRLINQILGSIREMKGDKSNSVRNFIHDAVRVNKESERNYREHVKSKFENVLSRVSSILEKQARALQNAIKVEGPLEGGAVEPQRKELSKDKILMFMRTPAAQSYGLDSLETMTRALSYPDLKDKITTIINAVERGHTPADGSEVRNAVAEIMKVYQQRQQTNLSALEQTPEKPAPTVSLFGENEPEE